MTEAAVQPRGNAVAQSSEAGMGDMGRDTGRSDGRNRRAAEIYVQRAQAFRTGISLPPSYLPTAHT